MMSENRPLWWQQPFTQAATELTQRLVIVTDIDGSLLDPGTRSLPDERAAIDFLAARGIPLVINSSRTRAEIERLHQTLQMLTPFISEHGGALFVPHGCFSFVPDRARPAVGGQVIEFGRRYHEVVDALRLGLRCCHTGSHYLVTATPDRAKSLQTLRAIWRQAWGDPFIVGIGDSEDDVAWLHHADVAVILQNDQTGVPARVLSKLPTVHVTRWPGRRGWSEAIFEFGGTLLNSHPQRTPTNELANQADSGAGDRPP
jgi:predicted mannosyl-3-phosphoglycerate phosphatase (HAD superfamily)